MMNAAFPTATISQRAGMICTMRDLRTLAKAHLHIHLEGAMRPSTLRDLADDVGVDVPPIRGFGNFSAFSGMYVAACHTLTTPAALQRLVHEVVEDAAIDGAVWIEPAIYLPHHNERIGPPELTLEIVLDAASEASRELGIGVGIIVAADRTVDPADSVDQARLAVKYVDRGVVGFGLANDETGWPPEPFADAFAIARDAGLLCVPHAGELAGPASVIGALDALGADRIQHGVRAIEDPALVQRLAESPVCLDVCPTSNVLLSVVPSIEAHPLPALLAAGVRCSLNSDDPLLFGPNLLEEYELARTRMGLDDSWLAEIARNSLEASGAPGVLKARGQAAVDIWYAENPDPATLEDELA
jgi:adenosine deaminase